MRTVKTIHLCQKLVQRLFPLIVSADLPVTFFTNGIDLINEYDTGSFFLCLLEKVTDFGSTHTYKHLHKLRTGNGEEGNLRLTGYRFCQQGLTCSRRAYKQGAFGHLCTNLTIFLRIMEKIHDLLQKLLRLILTCYIGIFDTCGRFDINFGIALSERHRSRSAHTLHHPFAEPLPENNKDCNGKDPAYQKRDQRRLGRRDHISEFRPCRLQTAYQIRIIHKTGLADTGHTVLGCLIINNLRTVVDLYLLDILGIQKSQKLIIRRLCDTSL